MKKGFLSTPLSGHLAAAFTMLVWGTTMVSSKVLLRGLTPAELIFARFLLAFVILEILPFAHKGFLGWKNELRFFLMGLSGVALYFFCENTALSYTYASNVSVIVATSPLFTALFARVFDRSQRLRPRFFAGFAVAILGIVLICFNGALVLKLNPLGDLLTLCAAVLWAIYCTLSNGVNIRLHPVQATRRTFFYGLICMLPILPFADFSFADYGSLFSFSMLANLCYLALIASALCYITWNHAIRTLSAVKTSVYIYGVPVVTVLFSAIFLGEKLSWLIAAGILLTITGLILSLEHKKT